MSEKRFEIKNRCERYVVRSDAAMDEAAPEGEEHWNTLKEK